MGVHTVSPSMLVKRGIKCTKSYCGNLSWIRIKHHVLERKHQKYFIPRVLTGRKGYLLSVSVCDFS